MRKRALIWFIGMLFVVYSPLMYSDDTSTDVNVDGRQLLVNDSPFFIKGVCWNPVPKGATHPQGLDFSGFADQDAALMAAAGFNTVRTYEPITDVQVLDTLYKHGIYVINTVYPWGGNDPSSVIAHVNAVKDHPAILMWCIGNEWNYNGIYYGLNRNQSIEKLNLAAEAIRSVDDSHPITTVYGHIPSSSIIDRMPDIDVWGLNVYSGDSFGRLFSRWENISSKPMYLAEYGADAWNAKLPGVDTEAQAYAARVLTQELLANSAAEDPDQVSSGGTLFEWADEWWKDQGSQASPSVQDVGGIAPGGGPYPDQVFNEEFWGIVDIDRNPRQAYFEIQALYTD